MRQCPGLYCGLLEPLNETHDDNSLETRCRACPRGYRVDEFSICVQCTNLPSLYDWLYLAVVALLPILLNSCFVEFSAKNRCARKSLNMQHGMVLVECSSAAMVSMVTMSTPQFSFSLKSCSVFNMADWYTILYNPIIGHATRLRCTSEAVYPRYSLPLLYYALCVLFMAIFRIPACLWLCRREYRKSGVSAALYAALYFYPILIFGHAVGAGFIYYFFPFIVGTICLVVNALCLAAIEDQTNLGVLKRIFATKTGLVAFATFSLVYLFCLMTGTVNVSWTLLAILAFLAPLPNLFYALTVPLSEPSKLMMVR